MLEILELKTMHRVIKDQRRMSNVTVFFDPLFQHEQTTENNIIRHIFERDLKAYNFNQALSHYKSTRICMFF